MTALLVTGTDTGVGKTFVTAALATLMRARGRRVGVLKPAETGVIDRPEDATLLAAVADDPAPLDDVCPYRLPDPLAPAVAARRAGVTLDVGRIVALIERRRRTVDLLLVEGAGGLLVPLAGTTTFLDLAVRARLPVLVVAANRLGTINHATLTIRAAQAAGLEVVGFVLSQPTPDADLSVDTNRAEIERLAGVTCLGELPHLADRAAAVRRLSWPPAPR